MSEPARNIAARPDPLDDMLEMFERQVELLLSHGAETALRTRLARLLPAPVPASTRGKPVWDGLPTSAEDFELDLVAVLVALQQFDGRMKSEASVFAQRKAKKIVKGWLAAAKEARGEAPANAEGGV